MATPPAYRPSMQIINDVRNMAKRAATKDKGTEFGTKCAILGMAGDLVLNDMTLQDFLDVLVAEVDVFTNREL